MATHQDVPTSLWHRLAGPPPASDDYPLSGEVDVVVVGAGLTGLRTADRLTAQGRRVLVLERLAVGRGCTGASTGHLSWLFDVGLAQLRKRHGDKVAGQAVHSLRRAVSSLSARVRELDPEAIVTDLPAWMLATDEGQLPALRDSFSAARALDLPVEWVDQPGLVLPSHGAFRCADHARIQPAAVCRALAAQLRADGCRIVEGMAYLGHEEEEDHLQISTRLGRCRAQHLVLATHTPPGIHAVQTALSSRLSQVLAVRVAEPLEDALYYDQAEPYRYLRLHRLTDGGNLVVVGGADRPVGSDEEGQALDQLRAFVDTAFTVQEEVDHWRGMFFHPSDDLPFIGSFGDEQRVWYATGFAGDGLTWGEVASAIIADGIAGHEHGLADLVRPQRLGAALTGAFAAQNAHVAKHFVGDRLPGGKRTDPADLALGEGAIVAQRLGHRAVARLDDGLHAFSATCPHMGCRLHYNALDRCFDCPCHGSRFALDGEPIEGPAVTTLKAAEVPQVQRR